MSIALMTFDFFGTVVDWRRGLREALGGRLREEDFDRVIDRQGELEKGPFRPYAQIVAQDLVERGVEAQEAARIAAEAGRWPLFPDSAAALRRLRTVAPCAATTNSDLAHGEQVQAQLGFRLDGWICAEEVRAYKPDARIWEAAARRMGVSFGRSWWHVSAYADYDLVPARELGLTCVFVRRPHSRPGPADVSVGDLAELAELVSGSHAT
jgi:2-haloalkanoic acid dehalogenase type II